MASSTSTSSLAPLTSLKVCFNSNCKQPMEQPKNGWRRRSGDFAELCDRCASSYMEGKFCETFHLNAAGWRCCETCGKQIHCGCIVSFHMFVLLDAGGIECLSCTKKSFILTPNPAWPPPSLFLPSHPERIKDLSAKTWTQIASSGPVPWRQAPSLFNGSMKCEPQAKASFEFDVSGGNALCLVEKQSAPSFEREKNEDSMERLLSVPSTGGSDIHENGNTEVNYVDQSNACPKASQRTESTKNDPSSRNINLPMVPKSKNDTKNPAKSSATPARSSNLFGKKGCSHNGLDNTTVGQVPSGHSRGDVRARNHLLPRYWPRITDQELQQISGENYVITPLFEKTLSASDAGRIGRLVLPKKCAEAYLPSISHPEGVPLEVQDVKGNEWVFQFRFWPNNNSRMYVLEGVTPCIQALQLQAGDKVTFSRIEPQGKLVMGGRKASTALSTNQGDVAVITGEVAANEVNSTKSAKQKEIDQARAGLAISKPGLASEERVEANSCNRFKRKNSTLASRSKRLRIDNEEMIELKLTWKQAQGLIRPPPDDAPKVIVVEGCEFEEYEDAPIIGRPTIPSSDNLGEKIQWVQCDECLKWRKIPGSILLPSRWTCSGNLWDPERSACSAAQELTAEHFEDLLPTVSKAALKKIKSAKEDPNLVETLEGLDALANLAIREEGTSLQATTRHPRHKPGCTCIVCMQPPSGKFPKHEQSCDCMVCVTVKRRFRTLMTKRREKQQLEKDADTGSHIQGQDADVYLCAEVGHCSPDQDDVASREGESNENALCDSPSKAKTIDLNSQPARGQASVPGLDSMSILSLLQDATGRLPGQQKDSFLGDGRVLGSHIYHQNGLTGAVLNSCTSLDGSYQRINNVDHHVSVPADTAASASTTQ